MGHIPLGQEFRGMAEEVTGHGELDALDLVGEA
jgi:hypothetical protein